MKKLFISEMFNVKNRIFLCAMVTVFSTSLLFCAYSNPNSGETFTDSRDGKKYRTVKIGNLRWMAQNLNYATPSGSFCYDDDLSNCAKYGRLYDWETAMTACPAGWRLPGNMEWNDLTKSAGGQRQELKRDEAYWRGIGKKLKSKTGWRDFKCNKSFKEYLNSSGEDCILDKMNSGNGTDHFGFSALPGGTRNLDGSFDDAGIGGLWWSATELGFGYAWLRFMLSHDAGVYEDNGVKNRSFSVLCVQE